MTGGQKLVRLADRVADEHRVGQPWSRRTDRQTDRQIGS